MSLCHGASRCRPDEGRTALSGINSKFDKEYIDKGIEELAKAPVEALKGLSEADAQKLKEALNIKTVKDLGTNKFFLWAHAVSKLAE